MNNVRRLLIFHSRAKFSLETNLFRAWQIDSLIKRNDRVEEENIHFRELGCPETNQIDNARQNIDKQYLLNIVKFQFNEQMHPSCSVVNINVQVGIDLQMQSFEQAGIIQRFFPIRR